MQAPDIEGFTPLEPLGSGGYGDVYAYEQTTPRRRVAIKVLRDAGASELVAEADAMAHLEHPHVVPIHQVGITRDGRPYLVMPLLTGTQPIALADQDGLTIAEVLKIGVQIGGAVATAHRHGLLHRDIKPANILADRYGQVALADFGLAGAETTDDDPGLTIPWSAPEVVFGGASASVASDVYSLGATVWTLLTGRPPFATASGDDRRDLLRRVWTELVATTGRPDVPAALESLLAQSMAKHPAARPRTALDLVRGLQAVERSLGLPVTRPVVGGPEAAGSPTTPSTRRRAEPPIGSAEDADEVARRPRRVLRWILAGAALAGLVATGVAWWSSMAAAPVAITGSRTGDRVSFAWTYPGQRPGDGFNVRVADRVITLSNPAVQIDSATRVCIQVQVVDGAGAPRGGYSQAGCVT